VRACVRDKRALVATLQISVPKIVFCAGEMIHVTVGMPVLFAAEKRVCAHVNTNIFGARALIAIYNAM
jgi:hypothetical protein